MSEKVTDTSGWSIVCDTRADEGRFEQEVTELLKVFDKKVVQAGGRDETHSVLPISRQTAFVAVWSTPGQKRVTAMTQIRDHGLRLGDNGARAPVAPKVTLTNKDAVTDFLSSGRKLRCSYTGVLVLTPLPSLTIFTEDEAYKQHSQTELILARLTLNSHRLADILAGLSITSGSRENPIDVEEDGQEEDGDGAKAGVLQSRAPEAEERGARDEVLLDGEVEDGEVEDGEVLEVEVTEGGLEEGEVDGGETDDEAPSSSSRKRRRRERSKERTAASRERSAFSYDSLFDDPVAESPLPQAGGSSTPKASARNSSAGAPNLSPASSASAPPSSSAATATLAAISAGTARPMLAADDLARAGDVGWGEYIEGVAGTLSRSAWERLVGEERRRLPGMARAKVWFALGCPLEVVVQFASMHNDLPTEPWLADYIVLGPSCSEVRVMQKREWDSRRGGSQESVWAGDKDVNANLVDLSWAVACINARRLVETRGHSA